MPTPPRAVRLTDRAPLEFHELETLVRTRRKLTFRAPRAFIAGADLVLPEDNAAEGALTKVGNVLTWVPGGGGGITAAEAQALIDASLVDYQLLSEKDQADGYASLDGSTLVPAAELGTGAPTAAKFLDGSRAWRVLADADIPAAIARDAEVTAAIAAHEAAIDPHTVYQRESEKSAASGYASLDGSTLVPTAELGTGSPSATKFLDGTRVWRALAIADGIGGKDIEYFKQVGTSPLECWYMAGILVPVSTSAGGSAPTADVLFAYPFMSGRGGTIDRLAIEITTVGGANSKARIGVYQATSDTNLYPSALLVDGGEIATNTGTIKTVTISTDLPDNKLCWAALLVTGGGGAVVSLRNISTLTGGYQTLGYPAAIGASQAGRSQITVAQTYGALPNPFTAGGVAVNAGNIFCITMRFSS